MYNEREEHLFQLNAPRCPSREAAALDDGTLPGCRLGKAMEPGMCINAYGCPIFYWLKVTGVLNKAVYDMPLHPAHGPDGVTAEQERPRTPHSKR